MSKRVHTFVNVVNIRPLSEVARVNTNAGIYSASLAMGEALRGSDYRDQRLILDVDVVDGQSTIVAFSRRDGSLPFSA